MAPCLGGAALDLHNVAPKPCTWISDPTWLNLVQLSTVRPFQHIVEQVGQAEHQWRLWFFKETPEDEPVPEPYHHLDVFKRLLLVRYEYVFQEFFFSFFNLLSCVLGEDTTGTRAIFLLKGVGQ